MSSPRVVVIVVAAGSGTRLGEAIPKAFVAVSGRTILERALDEILAIVPAPDIVVAVPADRLEETRQLVHGTGAAVVAGGDSRQASVARGLEAVSADARIVLVHDAARALCPTWVFERVIAEVERGGHGVVPGMPVINTIKRVGENGEVVGELDRTELREIQTPQGFPREDFVAAHGVSAQEFTDDGALFSAAGYLVRVVPGDALAFKITTPFDVRRAEQLLGVLGRGIRVGLGVDIHAFDTDRPLWLGGVHWPDEPGLAGHSDGDVVCHALCDAMLSAAGLGDIGGRFGTDDPRFAEAAGSVFVAETRAAVTAAGFEIVNIAVQVIANRPKIGVRRAEIERQLSHLVGAPVSVGATTSDGLGFIGRSEGVTAMATCQLRLR